MLARLTAAIALVLALAAAPAFAAGDPLRDQQWGLEMVEAPAAWPSSTGVGAVVAVIDSGVQADHPDLSGRLLSGFDYVDGGDPDDGDGHGTHVTGIVVATRENGEGIAGVAPGARVMPLRVLDDAGGGDFEDVRKAIERATAANVHVINLSLGDFVPLSSKLFEDPDFEEALRRALERNILVVFAAGNSSLPICENQRVEGTLCVGSVDRSGERSWFSSFGSEIDVMAPGGLGTGSSEDDILSTYPVGDYAAWAGTSQAAPHVAGVGALLASVGVRGRAAAQRILDTSSQSDGMRIVNARAALAGLAPPPPVEDGDASAPRGRFAARRRIGLRALRKRGLRVACRSVRPGRCLVRVFHRRKRIVIGGGDVPARQRTVVRARLTKVGRRRLARMKRKRIRTQLRVKLPGEPVRKRRLVIVRR